MQRLLRPRAAIPFEFLALMLAAATLLVVALSIALQPPETEAAPGIERALAWVRAAFFTTGALAFVLGLLFFMRTGTSSEAAAGAISMPAAKGGPWPAYTIVALGAAPDDTRAIADAPDADEAVDVIRRWSRTHPGEQLIIYAPDGEPIAFRRAATPAQPESRGAA